MSKTSTITTAITFIPSSYDSSSTIPSNYTNNTGNGLNNSGNTSTFAGFSAQSTSYYAVYNFDCSSIPANATINSVSCTARAKLSSTNNWLTRTIQLYNGTSAKGSASQVNSTSSTAYSLTPGTWTRNELNNIKLRITLQRSGNSNRRLDFYGATLLVNYTYQSVVYDMVASSETSAATITPASQDVVSGGSITFAIQTSNLNDIIVEDNGTDVTEELQYVVPTGGEYTFTGIPTSYDSVNSTYDGIYTGSTDSGLSDQNSNDRICVYANTAANSVSKLVYNFNCSSIPQTAIIKSVTCIAAASCYSNGQYFNTRTIQLYNGNTAKGTATTITGNGSTKANHNVSGGTWTRNELNDIKIVLYIQRGNNTTQASFSFWGATLTIQYELPSGDPYYEYTLNDVNADHTIVVKDYIFIPPEEDSGKTYYSLTVSSINATTEPGRGTTRVESGTSQTITIYPDDPLITLVTDNGVDITNQLVAHGGTIPDPVVTTAQGATYGFVYSASTGYYTSTNKGNSKTAAVCVVSFNLPVRCLVTIDYINYAEATYDFGVFGNIDVPLSNDYYAAGSGGATITDTNYKLACNTSTYNTSSVQTISYEIPSGQHEIYIKYSKDDATDSYNDTLQFKISNIEELEANNYYTYTLTNINQDHSLVFIFGDVTYYFINSFTNSNCRLFPNGTIVELPGDDYKLTIIPDNITDEVILIDNNNNVTNSLERKEVTIVKEGVSSTTVNYIYTLTNVQTAHNLSAITQSSVVSPIYYKGNNHWIPVTNIFKKINGEWIEQELDISVFENGVIYITHDE